MDTATGQEIVTALTEDQASRVTGISVGQLRAWDRRGFFTPAHGYENRSSAYSRIYSFKDIVGLKTIATLRQKHKIGFKTLRNVALELERRGYKHWADTRLFVVKKEVHFHDPRTGQVESLRDGQYAMLPVIDVIDDVTRRVIELKKRPQGSLGKVERHKFVARNSWVISGTRIPTASIRRFAEAGYTVPQIIGEYPTLTAVDIHAALLHEGFEKISA